MFGHRDMRDAERTRMPHREAVACATDCAGGTAGSECDHRRCIAPTRCGVRGMMRGATGPIARTPYAARVLRLAVLNGIVALVLAALAGGLAASVPAAAAAICPSCFGFVKAAPALYLERDATAADAARARAVVEAGRQRVRAFWGDTTAAPRVLVCVSDACFRRMGGGTRRALSLYDRVVVLSPRATDPQSVAHPFAAVEFEHRLGPFALADGRAPAWLGDSLATISAGTPDAAARCARDT
ncbi:hypothetical protein G3N92_30090, partial [Burkholderia sp. Ac-20379]|nr:hypothetical protein [Burkholderia sp. Ac-20379]